jgi:hypothetical protein
MRYLQRLTIYVLLLHAIHFDQARYTPPRYTVINLKKTM